jgi:predicted Zn-dependent peptidase
VQEALHERVLTLEDAIAELEAVTSERISDLCRRLIRDEALTLAVVAPPRRGVDVARAFRLP